MVKKYNLFFVLFFFIICCCSNNGAYIRQKTFFSEPVNNDMRTDLENFMKKIPINNGQQNQIERILKSTEYKSILLFIDDPFSIEVLNQVSQLQRPFDLIETLDILSYNQKMNDSFSNWYLSNLFSLVNNSPDIYMTAFLRLSQKSDGMYTEWFSDPLAKIIKSHPEEFVNSLKAIDNHTKLCVILKIGDKNFVDESIDSLRSYAKNKNIKIVSDFIRCFDNTNSGN